MQFSDVLALVSLTVSITAIVLSTWVAIRQVSLAKKDLTMTAYSNAIQGILGLKEMFREHHDIFDEQARLNPRMKEAMPDGMDARTFLIFATGFWRLSYIYSVMVRWKELGLTDAERQALDEEMRIWLIEVPGFRQVYDTFILKTGHHNPDFKEWLRKVYSSEPDPKKGTIMSSSQLE